jgi:hypothetical protein
VAAAVRLRASRRRVRVDQRARRYATRARRRQIQGDQFSLGPYLGGARNQPAPLNQMLDRSANLFADESEAPASTAAPAPRTSPVVAPDAAGGAPDATAAATHTAAVTPDVTPAALVEPPDVRASEPEVGPAPSGRRRTSVPRRRARPALPPVRLSRGYARRASIAAVGLVVGLVFAAGVTSLTRSGASPGDGPTRTAPSPALSQQPAASRARRAPAPRRSAPPARRVKRRARDRTPPPAPRRRPARRAMQHAPSPAPVAAPVSPVSPVASSAPPAPGAAEFSIER